jgi:hypothetical protein
MTAGQYPTISSGVGNLTPEMWTRIMRMLESFESKNRDERAVRGGGGASFFLAKLTDAKLVATNKYIYAWTKVTIDSGDYAFTDTTITSEGETDKWDNAALNLIEGNNTADKTATGVDEVSGTFPAGFSLQAIGGGSETVVGTAVGTLGVEPIVIMWKNGGRNVFMAANSYDGSCA